MSCVNIAVDIGMCVSLILPWLNSIVQLIIWARRYISKCLVDVGVGVWKLLVRKIIINLGILLIASMAARAF